MAWASEFEVSIITYEDTDTSYEAAQGGKGVVHQLIAFLLVRGLATFAAPFQLLLAGIAGAAARVQDDGELEGRIFGVALLKSSDDPVSDAIEFLLFLSGVAEVFHRLTDFEQTVQRAQLHVFVVEGINER